MRVLIVVDMQHDFLDGALGSAEAMQIIGRVQEKVDLYTSKGDLIIYTQDTHHADYLETQEGKNLPVAHCIKDTPGWQIVPEVYREGSKVIEKPTFGSLELVGHLSHLEGIESVELVGVCTDICVISNALLVKSALPEIPVAVDATCCAGVSVESHQRALEAMKMCQVIIYE